MALDACLGEVERSALSGNIGAIPEDGVSLAILVAERMVVNSHSQG